MQSKDDSAGAKSTITSRPVHFLRLPSVCARTGLSRSQIYRLEAAGQFCRRVKLSESCSAWIEEEVDRWAAERIAASRGAAA